MKKVCCFIILILVCLSIANLVASGIDDHQYVGAGGCKACHMMGKIGAQYKVWAAGKHAGTYALLASEKGLAVAKEQGVADPQKSEKCLSCHVTGHGLDVAHYGPKYKMEEGVTCEACHGAGSGYKKKATMKGLRDGSITHAEVGYTKPTKEICVQCHNDKSPTFKGFDFEEKYAKVSHPIPKAE